MSFRPEHARRLEAENARLKAELQQYKAEWAVAREWTIKTCGSKGSASTLRLSVRMLREDIDELQRKLAEYEDAPVVGHVADDGYFVAEHRNVWRHRALIYKPGVVKPAKEGTKS